MDPVAPRQGCELRDRVVYLGADAVRAGYFPEYPRDLSAQGGQAVVHKCSYEGHRCLLAPRWHSRNPQGPIVLQAVPRGVESVPRPVIRNLDHDVVQVARGVRVVGDKGGDLLYHSQ